MEIRGGARPDRRPGLKHPAPPRPAPPRPAPPQPNPCHCASPMSLRGAKRRSNLGHTGVRTLVQRFQSSTTMGRLWPRPQDSRPDQMIGAESRNRCTRGRSTVRRRARSNQRFQHGGHKATERHRENYDDSTTQRASRPHFLRKIHKRNNMPDPAARHVPIPPHVTLRRLPPLKLPPLANASTVNFLLRAECHAEHGVPHASGRPTNCA